MTDLKQGGPDCWSRPVVYLSGLAFGEEEHHEAMILHSTMHSSIINAANHFSLK
jgi:hypothetical protein